MKTFLVLFICIYSFSNLSAQDKNLIGTWNIVEFSVTRDSITEVSNKDKLKEDGSIWKLTFLGNGKIKQSRNMGTGQLESWEGIWKTSDDNSTLIFNVKERDIEPSYQYEIEYDVLVLTRSNSIGTMKNVYKFRKE
jgi:hypothetical protein